MASLRALLLDVDGTLADTERDGHRVAFNAAFAAAGLDWSWSVERYAELLRVTGGKERIRQDLVDRQSEWLEQRDLDARIRALHAAKTEHYVAMLDRGAIPLRSGVRRLLDEARTQELRLAIVTTTTPANVDALLRSTLGPDALERFECIAAGDVVASKKPAPEIYLWALEHMGLHASETLALEDSENGVRSACAAGVPVVVTTNHYTREQDFSGAAAVLDGLGEPGAPAHEQGVTAADGSAPWSGWVGAAELRAWHRSGGAAT